MSPESERTAAVWPTLQQTNARLVENAPRGKGWKTSQGGKWKEFAPLTLRVTVGRLSHLSDPNHQSVLIVGPLGEMTAVLRQRRQTWPLWQGLSEGRWLPLRRRTRRRQRCPGAPSAQDVAEVALRIFPTLSLPRGLTTAADEDRRWFRGGFLLAVA